MAQPCHLFNLLKETKPVLQMNQIRRALAFTCGMVALLFILTLAGCATWSDERHKHYSWLYEKCMRGEHEPYTIHMNRSHSSPLPQRCRDEFSYYVGGINHAL
jgi:hypothetical protein